MCRDNANQLMDAYLVHPDWPRLYGFSRHWWQPRWDSCFEFNKNSPFICYQYLQTVRSNILSCHWRWVYLFLGGLVSLSSRCCLCHKSSFVTCSFLSDPSFVEFISCCHKWKPLLWVKAQLENCEVLIAINLSPASSSLQYFNFDFTLVSVWKGATSWFSKILSSCLSILWKTLGMYSPCTVLRMNNKLCVVRIPGVVKKCDACL